MTGRPRPGQVDGLSRDRLAAWLADVDGGRLTRREFVARAAALGVSASAVGMLLAACGDGDKGGGDGGPGPIESTMPATLNMFNWAEYLSAKVKKQFQAQNKCAVNEILFDSNEQCVAGVEKKPDAYDVCFPEEWAAEVLMKAGLLYPLDMKLIPNFANVTDPSFRKPPYDPETDGKKYTVPYMFGSIGFGTRLDLVPDPPDSWEALYDKRYKKKITMLDGAREVLGPALFLMGTDPNTTDQAQIDEATQRAIQQKALVAKYDSADMTANMESGKYVFVECWDGDAIGAMNSIGLSKIRYVLPSEGYVVWADALCIPKSSPHVYAAHLFLNFLLDVKVTAENANYTGYQPVVEAADPLIKSLVQRAMRPTPEQIASGIYIQDLGADNAKYDAAWEKVQQA